MATTPTITDAGALAVTPARVNIFAKPSAPQDQTDPAARQPRGDLRRRRGLPQHRRGHRSPLPLHPRTAAVASVARGALRRQRLPHCPGSGRCEPHRRHPVAARGATARPRHRRHRPFASSDQPHASHEAQPATVSAARRQATQAAHTRRVESRARPARPAASGGRRRQPRRRARRALASPRPGPHVAVPARPLPTRVAPDAPPEFM